MSLDYNLCEATQEYLGAISPTRRHLAIYNLTSNCEILHWGQPNQRQYRQVQIWQTPKKLGLYQRVLLNV